MRRRYKVTGWYNGDWRTISTIAESEQKAKSNWAHRVSTRLFPGHSINEIWKQGKENGFTVKIDDGSPPKRSPAKQEVKEPEPKPPEQLGFNFKEFLKKKDK